MHLRIFALIAAILQVIYFILLDSCLAQPGLVQLPPIAQCYQTQPGIRNFDVNPTKWCRRSQLHENFESLVPRCIFHQHFLCAPIRLSRNGTFLAIYSLEILFITKNVGKNIFAKLSGNLTLVSNFSQQTNWRLERPTRRRARVGKIDRCMLFQSKIDCV